MLDFVKLGPAGTAEKVTFLNPYPRQFRNQKFNFSIPAHLPGRFSEDRPYQYWGYKKANKY